MRITISKKGKTKLQTLTRDQLSHEISETVLEGMAEAAHVLISPARLRNLTKSIEAQAGLEALRIFDRGVAIIKRSRTLSVRDAFSSSPETTRRPRLAFSDADLASSRRRPVRGDLNLAATSVKAQDSVHWGDLSPGWVQHKYGVNRQNATRFFLNTGQLASKITSERAAYVAHLGGVSSNVDTADLKPRKLVVERGRVTLGRVDVVIFPGLGPQHLPMLASRRWTDSTGGAFEKRFFGGRTGEKLAGPPGHHRPLFTPLIQFWLAFRIPAAIDRAVQTWASNPRRGGL